MDSYSGATRPYYKSYKSCRSCALCYENYNIKISKSIQETVFKNVGVQCYTEGNSHDLSHIETFNSI
jgi:hypothetical protein